MMLQMAGRCVLLMLYFVFLEGVVLGRWLTSVGRLTLSYTSNFATLQLPYYSKSSI